MVTIAIDQSETLPETMKKHQLPRTQSLLEPLRTNDIPRCTSSFYKIKSSSISRERNRSTMLSFELGRDQTAVWMNEWSSDEVCSVLLGLVQRCNYNQMSFLWTALESVPHRDFLYRAVRKYPKARFQPLSTPISREMKTKLQRSRYQENKCLFRTQSIIITHSTIQPPSSLVGFQSIAPKATSLTTIPGLRPATAPELVYNNQQDDPLDESIRLCSPTRRHMSFSLSKPGTPSCYQLPTVKTDAWSSTTNERASSRRKPLLVATRQSWLPTNGLTFLMWFTALEKDWQKKEVLQLMIWSLNQKELYHLAIMLLSRQYKDFVGDLSLPLSIRILSYVPGKDILQACRVSKQWVNKCMDENLWKIKCGQIHLGLSPVIRTTWRQLFIDDIKLKRNWRLGHAKSLSLSRHTGRVLCVAVNEEAELCATGGCDRTVKVWRLRDGKLLATINEFARVWSVCFYGLNLLISGSSDAVVKIWNVRTTKHLRSLEGHHGSIWALKQRGDYLVTGSHDNTVILWNIRQCKYVRRLVGHRGAVFGVDINEDTSLVFSCGGDKNIRVWESASGLCVRVIHCPSGHPILSLCYSKSQLAYSSGRFVYLWSLSDNKLVYKFKGHEDRVESVHLLREGSNSNTIVSCGRDGCIKYWNTKSGNCIRTLGSLPTRVNAIDRDSTRLVAASDDSALTIWDFSPLSLLGATPTNSRSPTSSSLKSNKALTGHAHQGEFPHNVTFDKIINFS